MNRSDFSEREVGRQLSFILKAIYIELLVKLEYDFFCELRHMASSTNDKDIGQEFLSHFAVLNAQKAGHD